MDEPKGAHAATLPPTDLSGNGERNAVGLLAAARRGFPRWMTPEELRLAVGMSAKRTTVRLRWLVAQGLMVESPTWRYSATEPPPGVSRHEWCSVPFCRSEVEGAKTR